LIEEIANYVKQNFSDPDLSLKSIIEEMGAGSYKSVSEEFKKKTGMKFIDYLHEIRNREAKRLLIESELMIFEISEKVGYLSGDAFGKAFKKINGVTPGQFRSGKKKN
jgi:YesN/AraC family two-component response regulator